MHSFKAYGWFLMCIMNLLLAKEYFREDIQALF